MRRLYKQFLDQEISRRDFTIGLAAFGFSAAAANSVASSLAAAGGPPPAEGVQFRGTGAEVLAETLRAAGIRNIFGTTATGMSSFFDALTLRPDMRYIAAIAESQATSMAHGYELGSFQPATLFVPGVAVPSTMNNLYNAWKDRSGILVFADSPNSQFPGRNGFEQMDDWLDPMTTFTKWRWQVDNPAQISEMTRRAIKLAGTQPRGPVHIRYALEVLEAVNVEQVIYPQSRFIVPTDMRPDPMLIEKAARMLLEAKKPLLCVGPEISRSHANDVIVELAELLGISVSQGYSVYGDFPQRNPLFVGNYGLGVPRGLGGTDVFLNIGAAMPDAALITAPLPRTTKVIQSRVEFDDIATTQPVDVAIAADARQTVIALIDALHGMATKERLETLSAPRLEAARASAEDERRQRRERAREYWDASPMSWERVSAELDSSLEDDAIIVPELDYRTPFHWLNLDRGRKWTIGQTTGFALGWGVGAALGVKVALPDRQVACLVGDGALLFGQIEALWTASRCDIPVLIVVMNNRSYDNERNRIQDRAPLYRKQETREQWKDLSGYLGRPDVDFAGIAQSFGIAGTRATKPEEFRKALQRAKSVLREGRPFLIDALIMQLDRGGKRTEQVWYPQISIAADRQRKV